MRRLVPLMIVLLFGVAYAQPRAWRDINFGDTVLDVADKLVQYDDVYDSYTPLTKAVTGDYANTPEELLRYGTLMVEINGFRFRMRFEFFDGRLFLLTFTGASYDASFFDTELAAAHDTLVQVITASQGEPTKTVEVGFFDMRNGFIRWTHQWATNTDGAAYEVGLAQNGFRYYPVMGIEWTWLRGLNEEALGREAGPGIDDAADDF